MWLCCFLKGTGYTMMLSNIGKAALFLAIALAFSGGSPAFAHPHVWVTVRSEMLYEAGKLSGLRHHWTFDEGYSAFAVQGIRREKDGSLHAQDLAELAKTNAEALSDSAFFTFLKPAAEDGFLAPREERLIYESPRLTLSFTLPLKTPRETRTLTWEVYDPSYFVAFRFADAHEAVTLRQAPQGCKISVTHPKRLDVSDQQNLSESFFEALNASSNFGAAYANRALVACP
jgi:ABC-type uncharacterized transport system substrate-binding protein